MCFIIGLTRLTSTVALHRHRQDNSRANLLNLEDENGRLIELLEDKGDISDLLSMNPELHNSLQTIVALHFDDVDEIISRTKGLYNALNTGLPDILEHFTIPSPKELEKEAVEV